MTDEQRYDAEQAEAEFQRGWDDYKAEKELAGPLTPEMPLGPCSNFITFKPVDISREHARPLYQCNRDPEHTTHDPIPARIKGRELNICPRCKVTFCHITECGSDATHGLND